MSRTTRSGDTHRQRGFDQVTVATVAGVERDINDISRFNRNSEARYKQDVVITVPNTFPTDFLTGKLVNGEFLGASLKDGTIVFKATAVVVTPYDTPVFIDVGTADAPKKYVDAFDCTGAIGTMTIIADCNTFVQGVNDMDIIVTVTGATGAGTIGEVAIILDTAKLGASTLMPSG